MSIGSGGVNWARLTQIVGFEDQKNDLLRKEISFPVRGTRVQALVILGT